MTIDEHITIDIDTPATFPHVQVYCHGLPVFRSNVMSVTCAMDGKGYVDIPFRYKGNECMYRLTEQKFLDAMDKGVETSTSQKYRRPTHYDPIGQGLE